MSNGRISVALALSVCVGTSSSFAQTTRLEQIDQEKDTKAAQVQPETRERGDVISTTLENLFAPQPPQYVSRSAISGPVQDSPPESPTRRRSGPVPSGQRRRRGRSTTSSSWRADSICRRWQPTAYV